MNITLRKALKVIEKYYGQYYRSVTSPYLVKEDDISATFDYAFDNGVLELRLPKAEEVKVKKIEIKVNLPEGETKKRQQKPDRKRVNVAV